MSAERDCELCGSTSKTYVYEVNGVPIVRCDDFGLEFSEQPFTELPAEPGSLDAVVLWDVIEHLPNPRETLEAAGAWLRPGGVVAISTGDVDSLSARLHGRDWSLMTPPWHQFYF